MTEFLTFQISLTMSTQIESQTSLTETEAWLIQKPNSSWIVQIDRVYELGIDRVYELGMKQVSFWFMIY